MINFNPLLHSNSLPLIQKIILKPPTHHLAADLGWNIATNWKLLLHYKMTPYHKLICTFFHLLLCISIFLVSLFAMFLSNG